MAEVTIQLRIDPQTGKKDIIINMRSDEEALPHEHERQHRAIVNKLLEGGVLQATELGQVVIEREEETSEPAAPVPTSPQDQRQAQAEGN